MVNIDSEIIFSNTPFERRKEQTAENDNKEEFKEEVNDNISFVLPEKAV